MNKIILEDEKLTTDINDCILINFSKDESLVRTLNIDVIDDTILEVDYNFLSLNKLDVQINVKNNVKLIYHELLKGKDTKIRTKYVLEDESNISIYKFNDIQTIFEYDIIYLNGKCARAKYNLKTISIDCEQYDVLIYHNACDTNSVVNINGVNIKDGSIKINVSSFVKNGNKNCNVNQNSRIINLTNNECMIKPNLYIDEYDVSANHSALIGNFDLKELFYLMSRGINKNDATKLLIKGFLTHNMEFSNKQMEKILNIINKYWG